jgi:outer membrane protein assembly factor BamB
MLLSRLMLARLALLLALPPALGAAAPAVAPNLVWNYTAPGKIGGSLALSARGDRVFALHSESTTAHRNATVVSIDAVTGALQWSTELPCPKSTLACEAAFGPVSVTNGTVIAATSGGLTGVAAATGQIQWQLPSGGDRVTGQPIVVQNGTDGGQLVICSTAQIGVLAIHAGSGEQAWTFSAGVETECQSPTLSVGGARVFVACNGQPAASIYAVLISDGSGELVEQLTQPGGINSEGLGLSGDGRTVFFGWTWAGEGRVAAVPSVSGIVGARWTKKLPVGSGRSSLVQAAPTIVPGQSPEAIIVADFAGWVRRLDGKTGNETWQSQPGDLASCQRGAYQCLSVSANPVFMHGGQTLLLSVMDGPQHGRVHAVSSADGSKLWSADALGSLEASTGAAVISADQTQLYIGSGQLAEHNGGNIQPIGRVVAYKIPPLQLEGGHVAAVFIARSHCRFCTTAHPLYTGITNFRNDNAAEP